MEIIEQSQGQLQLALDNCQHQAVLFDPRELMDVAADRFCRELILQIAPIAPIAPNQRDIYRSKSFRSNFLFCVSASFWSKWKRKLELAWHCLRLAGVAEKRPELGRLFEL